MCVDFNIIKLGELVINFSEQTVFYRKRNNIYKSRISDSLFFVTA